MLSNYLLLYHKEDLINILQDKDESKHFAINIKLDRLLQENSSIANKLLKEFDLLKTECNDSVILAQKIITKEFKNINLIIKYNSHLRLYNFPPCPELVRTIFPKNQDVSSFLEISGTVIRTTAVKLLEFQRYYKCTKCKEVIKVDANFEERYLISTPKCCVNSETCSGTNFLAINSLDRINSKDYQEIKIQEQVSQFTVGLLPKSLWVILEDDLVDSCKPGDNVTICGIVKRRWKVPIAGKKIEAEIVIKANHVYVNNDTSSITAITPEIKEHFALFWKNFMSDPLKGRDIIVKSFCPQVYGLHIVKLAIIVTIAGGSYFQNANDTGVKTRSEPHLLLVGDPGTGKSQLLRFASKVVSRSVLTTGIGSTSAGLTVTAVNENGEWQLEAGALVLSDGGVCCIDEFNSMKEHDRTSIHEAMEQQTISVAKASIVCKLNTRCSILAATNPKGHLDSSHPLSVNIAIPSPLLSRFDLVLILKDVIDSNWDNLVADYILNGFIQDEKQEISWDLQTLQAYIIFIKKIHPTLTDDTHKIISTYYQLQRKATFRNKARTTVRLLDSLVRLSQAHARLMFHTKVEVVDAVTAIILTEASMQGESSILNVEFDILSSSPENPMESYTQLLRIVLSKLELLDLLEKELHDIKLKEGSKELNNEIQNLHESNLKTIFKKRTSSSTSIVPLKRKGNENINEHIKKMKLDTPDVETCGLLNNERLKDQNVIDLSCDKNLTLESDSSENGNGMNSIYSDEQLKSQNENIKEISTNDKKIRNESIIDKFRFKPRINGPIIHNFTEQQLCIPTQTKSLKTDSQTTSENVNNFGKQTSYTDSNLSDIKSKGNEIRNSDSDDLSQNTRNKIFINRFCFKRKLNLNNSNTDSFCTQPQAGTQSIFEKEEDYDNLDLEI